MLPTDKDFEKLLELAEQYGRASVHHHETSERVRIALGDENYANSNKDPEVRAAYKAKDPIYATMTAEMDAIVARFPGLMLINPGGTFGWSYTLEDVAKNKVAYIAQCKEMVRDLAGRHWCETKEAEMAAIRKLLGPEMTPGQLTKGQFVFSTSGAIVLVTRVFKKRAHGVDQRGDHFPIDRPMKPISKRTANRIKKLLANRNQYLAERGLAA